MVTTPGASSAGHRYGSSSARLASRATNSSYTGLSTYRRSVHRQTWPPLVNVDRTEPSTAASRSASANTRPAFLPPSSNDSALTVSADAFWITRPVADSPVNVIASTPGCLVSASPADPGPNPCTRLNTPSGTPAAAITSASSVADAGFQVSSSSGRFHGTITATTPTGLRTA